MDSTTSDPYDARITTPWGDSIRYSSTDYSVGEEFSTTGIIFPYELDALATMVNSGDTVIDVGANNGYLACYFAHLVGPKGQVYAIEPARQEFRVMVRNLKDNDHTNVTCSRLLLGDARGHGELWLSGTNLGRHSQYPANVTGTSGKEVLRLTTADDYMDAVVKHRSIGLVKIDVEGAECVVLRGASRLLQRASHIWIEIWPDGIESAGYDPTEIIDTLTASGFTLTVHNIVEQTSRPVDASGHRMSLTDLVEDSPIVYLHGQRC